MADGVFYVDHKMPFISADAASVSLGTTNKAIIPIANLPILGSNYFNYVGKALRIRVHGRYINGATPGLILYSLVFGSGADNVGTTLASVNTTGIVNIASRMWLLECVVRCRSMGSSGSLFTSGLLFLAGTGQFGFPDATPSAVTVDLTAANTVITFQANRSGSTAESMQVHDVLYEALN